MEPYVPAHVAVERCLRFLHGRPRPVSAAEIRQHAGVDLRADPYLRSLLQAAPHVSYDRRADEYALYDIVRPPAGALSAQEAWLATFDRGLSERRLAKQDVRVLARLQAAGRAVTVNETTGTGAHRVWFAAQIPCVPFEAELTARVAAACRPGKA